MTALAHYTEAERRTHGRRLARCRDALNEGLRLAQVLATSAHAEGVPVEQLAEELRVDVKTVREWIRKG